MVTRVDGVVAAALLAVGIVVAVAAPEVAVLGGMRLAAHVVLAAGAWLVIGRVGAIDLSLGASAGAGALVGGITASQFGIQAIWLVPLAAVVGALVGAVAGAVMGRVGRPAGALATLALAAGLVAVGRAVPVAGGRSGFHAIPLLFGGDRRSFAVATVLAVVAVLGVAALSRHLATARAAVAVAAPPVTRSYGRRPEWDVALVAGISGAVLAVGGLVLGAASGSALSDGFGPDFLATVAVVAVLADRLRVLPARSVGIVMPIVLAVAVVHGPGVVFPLVPWIGTVSPLASTGAVVLLVLALTGDRARRAVADRSGGSAPASVAGHPGPLVPLALEASALAVPGGTVDVAAVAGEVVAVVGPNGVGKSTVLARIGGQLPDGGGVDLAGRPAPSGAVRRADAGVGRAWQRAVDVDPDDLVLAANGDPLAATWARATLGTEGDARVRAALVAVAARRPGLVLLDEPAAVLPAAPVAAYVRGLADAGAAVVLVEHRDEVVAVADRVVRIER